MADRKRIGVILPSINNVLETNLGTLAPEGCTYHTTRMPVGSTSVESLRNMNQSVEQCAELLSSCGMDVLAYCCTSGSFIEGPGYDQKIISMIENKAGIPTVATSAASVEAMKFLGLKRISVVTPYPDDVNARIPAFFEGTGFEIVNIAGRGLGSVKSIDICNDPVDEIEKFAIDNFDPSADGLFMSCTAWNALSVVERVEQAIGRPVVTANQATIWAAFRKLGYSHSYQGYGTLFREGLAVPA